MNPALLSYVKDEAPRQPVRHTSRRERRVSKRLDAEAIDRLVAEYVDGSPSAEIGSRYGIDKSSVLRLVRAAGNPVRYPRFSTAETAQLVALYEAGLSQVNIAERLGRSPSAVWHCLQRKAEYANPKGGAIDSGVRFFASPTCHHAPEVYSGVGESASAALLRDFFRERR